MLESQSITKAYEKNCRNRKYDHNYLTEWSRLVATEILPCAKARRTQEGRATNFKKILLTVVAALQCENT